MKARQILCAALAALAPLGAMTAGGIAHAQATLQGQAALPAINSFTVDEVRRIEQGARLHFTLYGTPGGRATIRIDGATRNLHMNEVEPGQYKGTYTIGTHDRIKETSTATAELHLNNRVATSVLGESLLRHDGRAERHRGELAGMPSIERFTVRGAQDLSTGRQLTFTVFGTPGAKVELAIAGSRGTFFLPEVRRGEYSGVYTVRSSDNILPDSQATATIRAGGKAASAVLGASLVADSGRAAAPQQVARYCTNCATVEAVNARQASGNGSVGGSSGGTTMSEAERAMRPDVRYEVIVRYHHGGATQSITYDNDPGFRVGDRVKVSNGVLSRDQ